MTSTADHSSTTVIQRLADPVKLEEELKVMSTYVKEKLFERLVFIWSENDLSKPGTLYDV